MGISSSAEVRVQNKYTDLGEERVGEFLIRAQPLSSISGLQRMLSFVLIRAFVCWASPLIARKVFIEDLIVIVISSAQFLINTRVIFLPPLITGLVWRACCISRWTLVIGLLEPSAVSI